MHKVPPKGGTHSMCHRGLFLTPSSCCIPCLHRTPLRSVAPTFSPRPGSTAPSFRPRLQAGIPPGLWLAVAVTIHLLTGPGWHRTGRGRNGSTPQLTTRLGCLGFCVVDFLLNYARLLPAVWAGQSKCFLLHMAAKERPLLERGWQEETQTQNFFDPSPPPPFEYCCPRSSWADVPLVFQVVPNSQPFASGALGLSEDTLSCEVSKAPRAIAACPQEPFAQGSSLPGPFGGGATASCVWRELSSACSCVSDSAVASLLQSQVNSRTQRRGASLEPYPK